MNLVIDSAPVIACDREGCGKWFFASAGAQWGGLIPGWSGDFDRQLNRFRDYCGEHDEIWTPARLEACARLGLDPNHGDPR